MSTETEVGPPSLLMVRSSNSSPAELRNLTLPSQWSVSPKIHQPQSSPVPAPSRIDTNRYAVSIDEVNTPIIILVAIGIYGSSSTASVG